MQSLIDAGPFVAHGTVNDGIALLTGVVPTTNDQDSLVERASAIPGITGVVNRLGILDTAMASAVADWSGVSSLVVGYDATHSGVVADTAERDAALAAATEVKGHKSIDDQLEVQTDLDEARLNELVGLEPIVFDSNNATIKTESFAVLDAAVEVLAATTGDVVIEGHTDTR